MNFLVSTQVIFQILDLWNITPYYLGGHKISGETCCLSLPHRRKETVSFYYRLIITYHQSNCLLCCISEVHGYMFRPLSGHPQAVKIRKFKITMTTSVMEGPFEVSTHGVTTHKARRPQSDLSYLRLRL
jgi:hypothetical protein